MGFGLDTFGDRREPKTVAQTDHSVHDRDVVLTVREARHECCVDLDEVDWEAPQIGQRCITRAEVVDAQADTELFEFGEAANGRRRRVDKDALGQLETEVLRRNRVRLQDQRDVLRETGERQLACRDVHIDLERGRPRVFQPAGGFRDCQGQHAPSCRDDQTGVLGCRDEVVRYENTALRIIDPHQGFEADDIAGCQVDERLVDDRDLLQLDRAADEGLGREPLRGGDQ